MFPVSDLQPTFSRTAPLLSGQVQSVLGYVVGLRGSQVSYCALLIEGCTLRMGVLSRGQGQALSDAVADIGGHIGTFVTLSVRRLP